MNRHINPRSDVRYLGSLTSVEVERKVSADSVLCLPIGSYEQHGPHLPLHTDVILAERFSQKLVARWGEEFDLWLLPAIPYGLSLEHAWAPGGVSLSLTLLSQYVLGMLSAVARAIPARHLLIVNGHGGNRGVLEGLVYEIRRDCGFNVCVTHPGGLSRIKTESPLPEVHGGRRETSVMLALAPEEVHLDRLAAASYQPPSGAKEAIDALVLARGTTWPWDSDDSSIASMGVVGDARGASASLGGQIVESVINEFGNVLRRLRERGAPSHE